MLIQQLSEQLDSLERALTARDLDLAIDHLVEAAISLNRLRTAPPEPLTPEERDLAHAAANRYMGLRGLLSEALDRL